MLRHCFVPASNKLTPPSVSPPPAPAEYAAAAVQGGSVVMLGGMGGASVKSELWRLQTPSLTWSHVDYNTIPPGRLGASLTACAARLYYYGGRGWGGRGVGGEGWEKRGERDSVRLVLP